VPPESAHNGLSKLTSRQGEATWRVAKTGPTFGFPCCSHASSPSRSTIAFGVALLTMPLMLGGLADHAGLSNAHWLVPILELAMLLATGIGRMIEKRR
jgi:hypothetical protein